MDALVMTAQLILGLSILVGLHELGHLVAAKFFGMRVEQFSIGFPPRIFGVKYGETDYSIGAIPLGGFVKISGMVDESLDTENLNEEPKPYEFRSKPAWQRLIVMMGGIVVNVILGIIIFIALTYSYGDDYFTKEEVNRHGIVALDLGQQLGLKTGDKIIKINGQDYDRFNDIFSTDVMMGDNSYYTVDRDGEILDIPIPGTFLEKLNDKKAEGNFIAPAFPFRVGKVASGTGAEEGGLKEGDKIVEVNGQEIDYFHDFQEVVQDLKGKLADVKVLRGGEVKDLKIQVSGEGTFGFDREILIAPSHTDYSLAEAIPKGTAEAFNVTWLNIRGVGKIFSGELSTKSLKGPIGIAQIFSGTWDWRRFWFITGMLSMWLAFVNFLPIPALDGGHVTFLTYEIISGRKPSDKFLENAQKIGMVLLLTLMVFVIFNDVFNSFF